MKIFENIKFGDKFITRDGRIAVFIDTGISYLSFGTLNKAGIFIQYLVNADSGILVQDGKEFTDYPCDLDIVGRFDTNDKLTALVKELLENNIFITGVELKNGNLSYTISGFAKSGEGVLYQDEEGIKLSTRYGQVDVINSFEDIVSVAYGWDSNYCCKDGIYNIYCVGTYWRKLYDKFGYNTENLM